MSNNDAVSNEGLERGLQERHIQLIAIGGAIGVGLFLGSSSAIKMAGPALMLSYTIGGIIIYFVMRALGEIAVAYPVSGSFSAYANLFLGPRMGYITGWTYWFMWVVTCMAEITAIGVYMQFWFPELPQWIPALAALVCMTSVNLIAVKAFGEFEFWFALIKIVTILAMIFIGLGMICFGFGTADGQAVGLSNLWVHGGFMPMGIAGIGKSMTMVMFAYLGIELIGVTAGEAAHPEKTIPSAIDKVFWRILIFYVGALFVIMSLFPWNEIGTQGSPFVLTFESLGIRSAAGIINFVVVTAALSSCNSGVFSLGRMLFNLSLQNRAPKIFSELSSHKVPAKGIIVSALFVLIGVILNYFVPEEAFSYITSAAAAAALWVWGTIVAVQLKSRKGKTAEDIAKLKYPMLFFPTANWLALICLAAIGLMLFINPETRLSASLVPLWLIGLYVIYNMMGWHKIDQQNAQAKNADPQ